MKNRLSIGVSSSKERFKSFVICVAIKGDAVCRKEVKHNKKKGKKKMTRDEFLTEMQDVLQTEDVLSAETVLSDLAEWDSLAMMATMAFLDKNFGVKVGLKDFKAMSTIADIMGKAGV